MDGKFTDEQYALIKEIQSSNYPLKGQWILDGTVLAEWNPNVKVNDINFVINQYEVLNDGSLSFDVHYDSKLYPNTLEGYTICFESKESGNVEAEKELAFYSTESTKITLTSEEMKQMTLGEYSVYICKDGKRFEDYATWGIKLVEELSSGDIDDSEDSGEERISSWISFEQGEVETAAGIYIRNFKGSSDVNDYRVELIVGDSIYTSDDFEGEMHIRTNSLSYYTADSDFLEAHKAEIIENSEIDTVLMKLIRIDGSEEERVSKPDVSDSNFSIDKQTFNSINEVEFTLYYREEYTGTFYFNLLREDSNRSVVYTSGEYTFDETNHFTKITIPAADLKNLIDEYYLLEIYNNGEPESTYPILYFNNNQGSNSPSDTDSYIQAYYQNNSFGNSELEYEVEIDELSKIKHEYVYGEKYNSVFEIPSEYEHISYDDGVVQYYFGGRLTDEQYTLLEEIADSDYPLIEKWYLDDKLIESKDVRVARYDLNFRVSTIETGKEYSLDVHYKTDLFTPEMTGYTVVLKDYDDRSVIYSKDIIFNETGVTTIKFSAEETRKLTAEKYAMSFQKDKADYKGFTTWIVHVKEGTVQVDKTAPKATLPAYDTVAISKNGTYVITFDEDIKLTNPSCTTSVGACTLVADGNKLTISYTAPSTYSTEVTLTTLKGVSDEAGNNFNYTGSVVIGRTVSEPVKKPAVEVEPEKKVEETTVVVKAEEVKIDTKALEEASEEVKAVIESLTTEELAEKIAESGVQSKFEEVSTTSEEVVSKLKAVKEELANNAGEGEEKVIKSVTAFDLSLFANISVGETSVDIKVQPKVASGSDIASGSDLGTVVYIPYPAGTDKNTTFHLYHEVNGEYVEEEIENTDIGIRVVLTSFSPFILVETGEAEVIEGEPDNTETDEPIYIPTIPSGSGTVITKLDANKNYSTIPTTAIINEVKKGKSATVKLTKGQKATKDIFSALKGKEATLTLSVVESGKEVYSFTFNGKDITDAKEVNLGLTFTSDKQETINALVNDKTTKVLNFAHEGTLPGKTTIRVYVADTFANGTVLRLDYFDEAANELVSVAENVVVTDGYVTFTLDHCSTYVLRETTKSLDLSAYSLMNMNVYVNSRVTAVRSNAKGFTVEGYMFEANTDCIYKDARNWREIVFVNAEDADMSKAYRKQVTAVYNTWLNSNVNATFNGKYKLNYANYTVDVDPNNMNAYVNNVAGQKMASGTYLVYMRISNGKESYLFPLVDRVLSDGSTMESAGTLPSGFSIADQETRTLMYTVK